VLKVTRTIFFFCRLLRPSATKASGSHRTVYFSPVQLEPGDAIETSFNCACCEGVDITESVLILCRGALYVVRGYCNVSAVWHTISATARHRKLLLLTNATTIVRQGATGEGTEIISVRQAMAQGRLIPSVPAIAEYMGTYSLPCALVGSRCESRLLTLALFCGKNELQQMGGGGGVF
jgi:hypothetical protein